MRGQAASPRRKARRTAEATLSGLAVVSALLSGCDLASLFGKGGAPSYLQAYAVTAAENPGLPHDETAIIEGTGVYLTLPYLFAVEHVAVTPEVSLSDGATIAPAGTYAVSDGMTLTVTQGGVSYDYELHVGVDPGTVASPPLLLSYVIPAAANPVLAADSTGVIYGNGVYVTLPFAVISEELPLTPSVTVAAGYAIEPSGTYALVDGMTLEVTQSATSELFDYTLHVAGDPATSPALPPLESYAVTAAENPSVGSSDADAVISGTDIYITLPYSALEAQAPLTPSVALQAGYAITPSGSYVLSDGLTLVVVDAATAGILDYTLHVAVATNTIP